MNKLKLQWNWDKKLTITLFREVQLEQKIQEKKGHIIESGRIKARVTRHKKVIVLFFFSFFLRIKRGHLEEWERHGTVKSAYYNIACSFRGRLGGRRLLYFDGLKKVDCVGMARVLSWATSVVITQHLRGIKAPFTL